MVGLVVFHAFVLAFVAVNVMTDRGIAERRRMKAGYGWFLELMARFEEGGGRVQELDAQAADGRQVVRKGVVAPWVLNVATVIVLTWLGAPIWIPAVLVASYVVVTGASSWLLSDLFVLADARAPRLGREMVGALLALALKGVMVALGIAVASRGVADVNSGAWVSGLAIVLLSVGLLVYCHVPVVVIERHLRRRKEVDFARTTKTDAVLFLRSFGDDDVRLFSPYGSLGPRFRFVPGRNRLEEVVAASLIGRSELVGVGKPGEKLPMLGASRTYWDHDNWKDAIRSTASRTDGVLVLAGKTPSLGWEVAQLAELGLLGKTLILFPPDTPAGTVERYSYIDAALGFPAQHRLPEELGPTLIGIAFDASAQPVHYTAGGRDWSSYLATLLHYQLALDGDIRLEAKGSVSEAVTRAEDPFNQAAHLLIAGNRTMAEAILDQAEVDPSDVSGLIGRAWERVALHRDFVGARQLLLETPVGDSGTMLERALEALSGVESGGDSREILRSRYEDRPQAPSDRVRVRVGDVRLGRMAGYTYVRLMGKIGSAEGEEDLDLAHRHSCELLELAEAEGISTFVAMAQLQLGSLEMARGELGAATMWFERAAALREAPRLRVSPILPQTDPVDLVDEALDGLVDVADHEGDVGKRNAALRRLHAHRSEYGGRAEVADAAERLGRSHGSAGDLDTARHYFEEAHTEYLGVGRLSEAGWTRFVQARAVSMQDHSDEALVLLRQATELAGAVDDAALRFESQRLTGDILQEKADRDHDQGLAERARATYGDALEAAREACRVAIADRDSTPGLVRERQVNLSIALNDLGAATENVDAGSAHVLYLEALSIRRALADGNCDDYWIARRLGFSLLRAAGTSRTANDMDGPQLWRECVTHFAALTSFQDHGEQSAKDLRLCINRLVDDCTSHGSPRQELEAVSTVVPDIDMALRLVVDRAPTGVAFKVTTAVSDLASELWDAGLRRPAAELMSDVLGSRRRISEREPGNRSFRRGVADALLQSDRRFLPDDLDQAITDFRELVSILEELVESANDETSGGAHADLLTGLMHAARALAKISSQSALEFSLGAVQVARRLLVLEPENLRRQRDLAWALKWSADAIASEDREEALRRYQEVLDLGDPLDHHVRWFAFYNSASVVVDSDPADAGVRYNAAATIARAQSTEHPDDGRWTWRLVRSLTGAAWTANSTDPTSALDMWLECAQLQRRTLMNSPNRAEEARVLAVALANAARLLGPRDSDAAADLRREADEYYRELLALDPANPGARRDVIVNNASLVRLLQPTTDLARRDLHTTWEQLRVDLEALALTGDLSEWEVEVLRSAREFVNGSSSSEVS